MSSHRFMTRMSVCSIVLILLFVSLPVSLAQDTNFCDNAQELDYGDDFDGEIDDDAPFATFCFEGEEGDVVVINVETSDGDLIVAVAIADAFVDDVFDEVVADDEDDEAEIEYELEDDGDYLILISREDFGDGDTEGEFEGTLELEGSSSSTGGGDPEGDFCERLGQDIDYGDEVDGEIDDGIPFVIYCFEGEEGDVITVEMEATDGDLEPVITLSTPDLTEIFEQDENSRGRDDASIEEYELEDDGIYMITATRVDLQDGDTEGEFELVLTSDSSSSSSTSNPDGGDSCDEYPLNVLSQYQWGIPNTDEDEDPLLAYNVGCTGFLASTLVGRSLVIEYEVDRDGELEFTLGETVYTSIEVDEDEWVLENSDGDELVLERLEDDGCEEAEIADLTRGAWSVDNAEDPFIFDFTCNGIVLITFNGETTASTYTFRRGDVEIDLGEDEDPIEVDDIEIDGDTMEGVLPSGNIINFTNVLD